MSLQEAKRERLKLWKNKIYEIELGFRDLFWGSFISFVILYPELPLSLVLLGSVVIPVLEIILVIFVSEAVCNIINYKIKKSYWGEDYKIKEKMWEIEYLLDKGSEEISKIENCVDYLDKTLGIKGMAEDLKKLLEKADLDFKILHDNLEGTENEFGTNKEISLEIVKQVQKLSKNLEYDFNKCCFLLNSCMEQEKAIDRLVKKIKDLTHEIGIKSDEILKYKNIENLKERVAQICIYDNYNLNDSEDRAKFKNKLKNFNENIKKLRDILNYYEKSKCYIDDLNEKLNVGKNLSKSVGDCQDNTSQVSNINDEVFIYKENGESKLGISLQ